MDGQLTELLTNYGPIGGIWFDGMWDKPDADWRLSETYGLIHRLQPTALIGSNHHLKPFPGEDFQMFEKDLPGQKTASFNKDSEVSALPLETCDTINGAWGYNKNDKNYKSSTELIHYLIRAAGNNANFLLNVGPRPDGTIQQEFVERLQAIGNWLTKNGESIYGTRGGPIAPGKWCVTTQKDNKVYVHALSLEPDEVPSPKPPNTLVDTFPALVLPRLDKQINRAYLMQTGENVGVHLIEQRMVLTLPPSAKDPIDNIVVLETK